MRDEHDDLEASTERAWRGFRQRLADGLAEMAEDDVLLVEVETGVDEDELDGAAPYVQFVAWGAGMLRAEVASNNYLDERYELSLDDALLLAEMGWTQPAYDDAGDPIPGKENFHLDTPRREADRVAVLTVRAIREVFGCPHPAFLSADGLERGPETPAVAPARADGEVELTYPDDHDELQALVDGALEVMFESPARHDEDGDLPITCGESLVFVRVLADEPTVEVFADIVVDVGDRARAMIEAARLNLGSADHQFVVRGDRLVMRTSLVAWPFSPTQLRVVVGRFCHEVDDIAAEAATSVGGRRFLEPVPTEDPAEKEDVHPGLATLLEILHTGRVGPATVAGLFDGDRRELVHQIHGIRAGGQACGDHAEEVVLDHLRRGLRFVADREASREQRTERRSRRAASSQLSLLPDEDVGQDSLGVGWGT
jgi:hypothetical protein